MKSIPDVPVENDSDTLPSGGGGGGSTGKVWTITGRLCVYETEIDGDEHDRPLKGIEVKVSASDLGADGPWTEWGTVRTDADGDFTLTEANNGNTRFFRVQARLVGPDLEVNDSDLDDLASLDLLDLNWRTVWKSGVQLAGPTVTVGTRVFKAGNALDLGNATYRRQALIWYVLRTAIDRLESEDPWFAMNGKIAAIYPAHVVTGTSYANGLTRMIYLHQGQPDNDWWPDVVLHEFMHLWNYDHNTGTINWLGAVCSLRGPNPIDLDTHAFQENPNVAFAEGFSEWASNALLHELWGVRLEKPLEPPLRRQQPRSDHAGDGREVRSRSGERASAPEVRRTDGLVEPPVRHLRVIPGQPARRRRQRFADYPDEVGDQVPARRA